MKHVKWIVFALVAVFALGVVVAQALVQPEGVELLDPSTWLLSTAALAFVVFTAVAFIKAHILKDLHDAGTIGLVFGLGIGIAILTTFNIPHYGQLYDGSLLEAVGFGFSAALLAAGGVDGVKGVLGGILGKR